MTLLRLTYQIEDILRQEILSNATYNWREEFIVRSILTRIRNEINNYSIDDSFQLFNIRFNVFQTDRTYNIEEKFGDIAFILNIEFNDGDKIEGVGLVEAKIREKSSNKFTSIRTTQLKRINKNAPHSLLLLLDYEPINKKIPVVNEDRHYYDFIRTHATVTQINTALYLNRHNTNLYKVSYPFSYQLTHRYFYGLDLEFDPKIIRQIKGFAERKAFPEFAVFITITPKNNDRLNDITIDVNRELYKEI